MLKLAIAFIAVVAVMSTVVTAVNQVIQSVTPLRFWWMRRGVNVAMRNLELGDRGRSWVWVWEWLGLWPHRWTRELLWDPRVNPTSDWWPDWVDGEALFDWLGAKVQGRPDPVGWAQDRERFLAWWGRLESAQTRGFKRMLLGVSAGIGIAMCVWLGLDPRSLAETLQEDLQLVSVLSVQRGVEDKIEELPDFEAFAEAFAVRLAEQPSGVSAEAASGLKGLAELYFRTAEGGTLAERTGGVADSFEALRERTPAGTEVAQVSAAAEHALDRVLVRQASDARLAIEGVEDAPVSGEAVFLTSLPGLAEPGGSASPAAAGAYILWVQHERDPAAVLQALDGAEAQAAVALASADIDAGVAAARATWRGYSSPDPDLLALLRAGPHYSWGALLMGCLIGFGAPFWFELLEAIIAGVRGRRYRPIKIDPDGSDDDE